jgi:hypothetical protein
MDKFTEEIIKSNLIGALENELHYLDEILKYLNNLYILYSSGKLENKNRHYYTEVGITNCNFEIERVKKEIEKIKNENS